MTSPAKRKREREQDDGGSIAEQENPPTTTNFRNVSACNRCRTRKNRCDQKLPRCSGCAKAGVKCVGFDPVSRRAIPRSYVYYLETRVRNLEALLQTNDLPIPPPEEDFAINDDIKPGKNVPFPVLDHEPSPADQDSIEPQHDRGWHIDPALQETDEDSDPATKLATDVPRISLQGKPPPRNAEGKQGVSFARVVLAAVKSCMPRAGPDKSTVVKPSKLSSAEMAGGGGTISTRDGFFGLHSRSAVEPAPFPDEATGRRLVEIYFDYANCQIPVLHRGEFEGLFAQVYAKEPAKRTPRELYLLTIVFAIGSGIIMDSSGGDGEDGVADAEAQGKKKRQRRKGKDQKHQPEEYHSSAVIYLETFLSSSPTAQHSGPGLEELQAVLLLASLALLRPVAPGLWYIIGVAVRLAVDLGLHSEDIETELDEQINSDSPEQRVLGRRQWCRDLRRRLWWCVYGFDRLVSVCVGRPIGITDQVVTTEFPSLLEDKYITPSGFLRPPSTVEYPTSKLVSQHYVRLRLLQSEILQVLQYKQAQHARMLGANTENPYIHTDLASPFMSRFSSFREWRWDIDQRLRGWKESIPEAKHINVGFTPLFFELNYWQATILLYRNSLAVPEALAAEVQSSAGGDVRSPGAIHTEMKEDEQLVFMKVAQAGQCVLKIYRQLHRLKLVNYTFLASHHIFMSGISFLYAIWHSPLVRAQLTLDDVDFTILVATSVLTDLSERCPPAEACRDALIRMSKATIAMVEKSTGFGTASTLSAQVLGTPGEYFSSDVAVSSPTIPGLASSLKRGKQVRRMTMPKFDMNLKDLFSDEEIANTRAGHAPFATSTHENRPEPSNTHPSQSPSYPTPSTKQFPASNNTSSTPQDYLSLPLQNSNNTTNNPFDLAPYTYPTSTNPDTDMTAFLDLTFPIADPSNSWGANSWSDLNIGTGGGTSMAGFEEESSWDHAAGVDLFGGLFFGGEGGGGPWDEGME